MVCVEHLILPHLNLNDHLEYFGKFCVPFLRMLPPRFDPYKCLSVEVNSDNEIVNKFKFSEEQKLEIK